MASMHMFNQILESRGVDAAARYAVVAQFGPGIDAARQLREASKGKPLGLGRPTRIGKTARDLASGATARWRKNREQRRSDNQSRCTGNGGGNNKKKDK